MDDRRIDAKFALKSRP